MSRLRRTFLDGSAEFYLVAGKPKLRIWGVTANGKLHEVLVDLGGEQDDYQVARLIRSARAVVRRRREREDAARKTTDTIAEQTIDLRELPR